MADFTAAQLDDIEMIESNTRFRAVREHFGITTFGVNAMTAAIAGELLVTEHSESEEDSSEELYVVTDGRAFFEIGDETVDAPAGTYIHVPAGVRRKAIAEEDGTVVLVVGAAAPGKVYRAERWERFAPLMPLFEQQRYEEGADLVQELLATDPESGSIWYNAACFESRAGRIDDALRHLGRGLELRPGLAPLAREDEDLNALRERPEFEEMLSSAES